MENSNDDKTPIDRPTSTAGSTALELELGTTEPGAGAAAPALPPVTVAQLLGRLLAVEARIAQLEGRHGNVQDQIRGLHALHADNGTVIGQHEADIEQLHHLVGEIHAAVVPAGPQPMRSRDERRYLPTVPGSAVLKDGTTVEGRETSIAVDPSKTGQQIVTLEGGQEVEINVRRPPPAGGFIRDGRRTGGTRRG